MVGIRVFFLAAAVALAMGVSTSIAIADQAIPASGPVLVADDEHHGDEGHRGEGNQRARAIISGTIIGVDYMSASILVATPRGVVPVAITPSTGIYRGNAFASFADIGRGARVEIEAAQVNGRLVAQFIRIR